MLPYMLLKIINYFLTHETRNPKNQNPKKPKTKKQ